MAACRFCDGSGVRGIAGEVCPQCQGSGFAQARFYLPEWLTESVPRWVYWTGAAAGCVAGLIGFGLGWTNNSDAEEGARELAVTPYIAPHDAPALAPVSEAKPGQMLEDRGAKGTARVDSQAMQDYFGTQRSNFIHRQLDKTGTEDTDRSSLLDLSVPTEDFVRD